LEAAILREIEAFLLELGGGFTFVARQKRMAIDGKDFALDLLFYHRKLRRLIAVDLKLGEFEAAFKGQMELYLRWLDFARTWPTSPVPITRRPRWTAFTTPRRSPFTRVTTGWTGSRGAGELGYTLNRRYSSSR